MNKALRIAVLAAVAVIVLTSKSAHAAKVTTIPVIVISSTP